jgi:hypothetical protein
MIAYEIEPTQPDYLLQEDIDLTLRISNRDSRPVEVPDPNRADNSQPVFGIIGPPYPQGLVFSNWSVANPGQPAPPVGEMTLAPGATWEGQVPLSAVVSVAAPGDYRVSSVLAFQGGNVRAPERSFRVNHPDPISVHIGQGVRPFDAAQGQIVFLQREAKSTAVYSIRFDESDPSNSEIELQPVLRRSTAAANAADISSPWRNTPFFDEMLQWIVWREGRSVKALNDAETKPVSFDLPNEPAYLVRPPLKTNGGPVEVMAVSADRRKLLMVSIPSQLPSKPNLAWQVDLPAPPDSIAAALGPPDQGNLRHLAFAVRHSKGFDVYHATYREGAAPGPFETVRVDSGRLRENVPVALAVTGDGAAHVAVLGAGDHPGESVLVEVVFHQTPGAPVLTPLPPLEKEPTDGAIFYVERRGDIIRRDSVLSTGSEVWCRGRSGGFVKIKPRPFLKPLALAAGKDLNYLLYCDRDRGFQLQPFGR